VIKFGADNYTGKQPVVNLVYITLSVKTERERAVKDGPPN
jgi:hypothetical protein